MDVLYGSSKSGSKLEDRLGVRERELEKFAKVPKAYQLMGVCDQRDASTAVGGREGPGWGRGRKGRDEAHGGQGRPVSRGLLGLHSRESESLSSPSVSGVSQAGRTLSLSQLSQLRLASPKSSTRPVTQGGVPPLAGVSSPRPDRSSRTTSNSALSVISDAAEPEPEPSPRGRTKVILEPLGSIRERQKRPPHTSAADALLSQRGRVKATAERLKAEERATRLRRKMRTVKMVDAWQHTASHQRVRGGASPQPVPGTAAVALQLGVTGRAIARGPPPSLKASTVEAVAPASPTHRPLNAVKLGKRGLAGAEGWRKVGHAVTALNELRAEGVIVTASDFDQPDDTSHEHS